MAERPSSSSISCQIPRKKAAKKQNVVAILITDSSLLNKWSEFCYELECQAQDKLKWERGINNRTFQYYDVFSEMLDDWIDRNSNKMTVDNLCRVLRGIECVAVAEKLEKEFKTDEIIQQGAKNSSAKNNVFLQNGKINWPLKHGLFVPTGNFTGREEQLEEIKTNFNSKNNLMLITGFGGIGKTELCRKFAYEIVNYAVTSCVWLHGENYEALRGSVFKVNGELGVTNEGDPTVSECFEYIATFILENSNRLLLVIDNVDIIYPEVEKVIEIVKMTRNEKMFVIVTSRDSNILQGAGITIKLDVLSKLQARNMLQSSMSGFSDSDADKLSELVEYFPLALQQALCYIKQQRKHFRTVNYSVTDYVDEFEVKKSKMLDQELNKFEYRYSKTTSVTWDITISKISQHGVDILKIISYLDPNGVELDLLEEVCLQMGLVDFDGGLHMLNSYCLVKIEDFYTRSYHIRGIDKGVDKRVSVHRLVQEVMRGRVGNEDYIKILFDTLFLVLWKLFWNRVYFFDDVHLKSVFKFVWKCEMRRINYFEEALFFLLDLDRIDCAEKLTKLKYPHIEYSSEFGVEKREFIEKVVLWSFFCQDSSTNSGEIAKGEFHVRWELVRYVDFILGEAVEVCLQIFEKYFDESSSKITFAVKYLLMRVFAERDDFDRYLELCEELTSFPFEDEDGQAIFLYQTICYILSYLELGLKSFTRSRFASLEKIMNKIGKTNPNDSIERMQVEARLCDLKGDYKKALDLYTKLGHEGEYYEYKIMELRIKLTDFDRITKEEFLREFGGFDFYCLSQRGLEQMLAIYKGILGESHELTNQVKKLLQNYNSRHWKFETFEI